MSGAAGGRNKAKRTRSAGRSSPRKNQNQGTGREEASGSEEADEDEDEDESSDGELSDSAQGKMVSELQPAWFSSGVTTDATKATMKEWLSQLNLSQSGKKDKLQARLHKHLVSAAQQAKK